MLYIAEAATGINESEELKVVKKDLEELKTDLERKPTPSHKESLENSRYQILEQIAVLRKHINEIVDALQQKVMDEIEKFASDISSSYEKYQKAHDAIFTQIQQLQQQLESIRSLNESQAFITMKKCLFQIPTVRKSIEEIPREQADDQLFFEKDPNLESFLASIERLGTVTVKSSESDPISTPQLTASRDRSIQHSDISQQAVQAVSNTASHATCNVTKIQDVGPLKVSRHERYNIKMQSDKKKCSIEGICLMPDGSIILTDYENRKIKRLDSNYQISDHLDMLNSPFQVCIIDSNNIIVASNDNLLNFVEVQNNILVLKSSISLSHPCLGVAYIDNRLFVSDACDKVFIYTMNGTHIRTIKMDDKCQKIFSKVRKLASSPDDTYIYVADHNNDLITLDKEGAVVSTIKVQSRGDAESVYVDMDGRVLVCYLKPNTIMQMNKNGTQAMHEVVKLKTYERPVTVCIDHKRKKMLVSLIDDNYCRVYNITNL